MKISDDELLKKVSGGVLPAGWEKQVDFMIAEFHSQMHMSSRNSHT